jgi:hypothetical protein
MLRLTGGAQSATLSMDGTSVTYAVVSSGDTYVQYPTASSGGLLYANTAAGGGTTIQLSGYEMPVF